MLWRQFTMAAGQAVCGRWAGLLAKGTERQAKVRVKSGGVPEKLSAGER